MPTIIFKPTEACNSSCIYCDVVTRKAPKTMKLQLLELIFRRINEYLKAKPSERITLIWHGGEPLLLGVDYFRTALKFQKSYCAETRERIEHAIQSNLTLLNQDFVDVFRELGIHQMGTSFEPIANIRGPGVKRDSEWYNRKFMEGINLLARNNMGWGFIYVVTRKSLERPLELFHYLSNFKMSGGFNMNPVLIYGEDTHDIAITPVEFADFLGAIFPQWWKNRHRYPDVNPFKSILTNYQEQGRSLSLGCVDSGNCAHSHLYIGPEGETSQCGRAGDWQISQYGNVQDQTLEEIFNDPGRNTFVERTAYLKENDCKGCRFWELCHGGCPLDAYHQHKEFLHKTMWCEAKTHFLERYFEPVTGMKFNAMA